MKLLTQLLIIFSTLFVLSNADCSRYQDCASCAAARGWDGQCRWCPRSNDGGTSHCHDPGSLYDKCSKSELVTNPMNCPTGPAPAPTPVTPPDVSTMDIKSILEKLLLVLGITDVNVDTCSNDVTNATMHLRNFEAAVNQSNPGLAVSELAMTLTSISTSVNDCNLSEIQIKLDALAARLHYANISKVDTAIDVVIDSSHIWDDMESIASAVSNKDASATATALLKLESDWNTIVCTSETGEACKLIDGLLKMLGLVAQDFSNDCAKDLTTAMSDLTLGFQMISSKNYTSAVKEIAAGMDSLAQAVSTDACQMKGVGAILSSVAPKLEKAIVNETSSAIKIIVGSADVYEDLYNAVKALESGDVVAFGEQMGNLLSVLRASDCKTKACTILEGLLQALQLEASDYSNCAPTIDESFADFEKAISAMEQKQWVSGLKSFGSALKDIADAVSACGVQDLAKIVEDAATKLGDDAVANVVGKSTQILVNGADVVEEIAQATSDWNAKNYKAFGQDLSDMASRINGTGCTKWICKLTEGFLDQLGLAFEDLEQCEADIAIAESNLTKAVQDFRSKNYESAVKETSQALHTLAVAVKDCGITKQLSYLEQEANVFGISTVVIGEVTSIVVHGADFFDDLDGFVSHFESHDYVGAGQLLSKILDELSQWTEGHSCTDDLCYVVEGVMEFMGDIEGDIKSCEMEFEEMFGNFTAAYHDFTDEHGVVWEFVHDKAKIKKAVGELGLGFELMSKAVGDCHLEQLAEILAAVATKLGVSPEVELVEEAIKILVEGVQIEEEIGEACVDYSQSNWIGFGYNIAKLLKMLL